jgi:hypothetical protein
MKHATWRSPMPVDPTAKKRAMIWTAVIILALTLPFAAFAPWYGFLIPMVWFAPVVWPVGVWAERKRAQEELRMALSRKFDFSDPAEMPATLDVFRDTWFIGSDAGVITFGDGHQLKFEGLRCDFELARQDIEPTGNRTYVVLDADYKSTDLSFKLRPLPVPYSNEYPSRSDVFAKKLKQFLRSGKKRDESSLLPPNEPFSLFDMEPSDPLVGIGLVFALANLARLITYPRSSEIGFLLMLVPYAIGVGLLLLFYRRSRQRLIDKIGSAHEHVEA